MRWRGRRQSSNVEHRRGSGGRGFGLPTGRGRMRLPTGSRVGLPRGRASGGSIIGLLVVLAILWMLGVNPLQLISGESPTGEPFQPSGTTAGDSLDDEMGQFVATVLADTEDSWVAIFDAANETYRLPTLVLFSGSTRSACGFASAASGPFYCPGDERIFIDLAFYRELRQRFQAPGDFAQAYVLAHEVGHHVQKQTGVLQELAEARGRVPEIEVNKLSVRIELQADCYAGIWAHDAEAKGFLETGDIDEALNAASQIGDDTIQKNTQGYAVPDVSTTAPRSNAPAGSAAAMKPVASAPATLSRSIRRRPHPYPDCRRVGRTST